MVRRLPKRLRNVFSRRGCNQNLPGDRGDAEDFRERGCEVLKVLSAFESKSICAATERNLQTPMTRQVGTDRHLRLVDKEDIERQNKVKRLKSLKRALERRRKHDNMGSFAANMVTYRDGNDADHPPNDEYCAIERDTTSHQKFTHDDRSISRSSVSTCLTNDFTLHVIEEGKEYEDSMW